MSVKSLRDSTVGSPAKTNVEQRRIPRRERFIVWRDKCGGGPDADDADPRAGQPARADVEVFPNKSQLGKPRLKLGGIRVPQNPPEF